MSCNFLGLSFKAETLRKSWMFVTFSKVCRFWFRKYCWSDEQHRRENVALLVQIPYQAHKSTLLNTFSEVSHRHHQASGLYNFANLMCNSYLGFIPSQIEIKSLNKGHAFKRNLGSKQRADALKKSITKALLKVLLPLPSTSPKSFWGERKLTAIRKGVNPESLSLIGERTQSEPCSKPDALNIRSV